MNITYVNHNKFPLSDCSAHIVPNKMNNAVNFGANPTPCLKTTYEKTKELYKTYKSSLYEVSFHDIVKTTNNVVRETGCTKKEAINAMQQLTQFANMRSLKTVANALEQHNICYIGSCFRFSFSASCKPYMKPSDACPELRKVILDDLGLHNTLYYVLEKKGLGNLSSVRKKPTFAMFLDEHKILQLEELKKNRPDTFKKFTSVPNVKYFIISGFENGISFVDRSKNLEDETIKLINQSRLLGMPVDKVIDKPLVDRAHKLGIKPVIIKKEGMPTESCVYNQMRPEQMCENELHNLIDANAQIREENILKRYISKEMSIDFLKNHLKVYTPEKMTNSLKSLHGKILDYAEKHGYKPSDIIYIEPDNIKSYSFVNYSYREINNIPENQFVSMYQIRRNKNLTKNKLAVFLDDCTISGDSVYFTLKDSKHIMGKKNPKLFACICGTNNAKKHFKQKYNSDLIIKDLLEDVPTKRSHLSNKELEKAIGNAGYCSRDATCLVLSYMGPDNNVGLGANIALLHNVNYRTGNPSSDTQMLSGGTKNVKKLVRDVAKLAHDLKGYEPVIAEADINQIRAENKIPVNEKLKKFISNLIH